MLKVIENDVIYLRRFDLNDAHSLFELDSDKEVLKYIHVPPVKSIKEVEDKIQQTIKQYEEKGMGRLAIIDHTSNEFIGWAGIKYETNIREFHYYDLGYRLLRKHWRKGYGEQAALLSLTLGFDQLNLDKICAAADITNIGSNKILRKIGLRKKGGFNFEDVECNWFELYKHEYDARKH